jgi:hypothetical protein
MTIMTIIVWRHSDVHKLIILEDSQINVQFSIDRSILKEIRDLN